MIARVWCGVTPSPKANAYAEYLARTGLKDCRETAGNRGAYILRQERNGHSEFVFISLWESLSAIQRFAGPDSEKAVYYAEDKEFLVQLVPYVLHYEVLAEP